MRYTNKEKMGTSCDAALCKTFAGEPKTVQETSEYQVRGCLYLYTNTNEIAMELYSYDPAKLEDVVSFILADKDAHEMVHRYYRKGRRDPYSIEIDEDASNNKDVSIVFTSKAGQGVVHKRRHLLHMCWNGTVHKIERMYIGDFVECIYKLQIRGFDFSKRSTYVYTRPHFAVNASAAVHHIIGGPMVSLCDVKKVVITEWWEYGGGTYSHDTFYYRDGDRWSINWDTSIDLQDCPYCGSLEDDCTHPQYISTDKMVEMIVSHRGNPDFTIELTKSDGSEVEL